MEMMIVQLLIDLLNMVDSLLLLKTYIYIKRCGSFLEVLDGYENIMKLLWQQKTFHPLKLHYAIAI